LEVSLPQIEVYERLTQALRPALRRTVM